MSTHSVEAKSETGRSGAKVEFDKSTNTVKLTGFYDTYVKLNLRKNEWSLEDFLRILGIDEVIERKYKKEQKLQLTSVPEIVEVKQPKESPKPVKTNTKKKVVTKKEIKPKVSKKSTEIKKVETAKVEIKEKPIKIRPKKVEYRIQDKTLMLELENLKPVSILFKYRKERVDATKGSIYVFITHSGNRVRFTPKGCSSILEDIMDIQSNSLNKKNKRYSELNKTIDSVMDKCKKIFKEIDSKYKKDPAKYSSKVELENVKKKILA